MCVCVSQEEADLQGLRFFVDEHTHLLKEFSEQLERCVCTLKQDVAAIVRRKREKSAVWSSTHTHTLEVSLRSPPHLSHTWSHTHCTNAPAAGCVNVCLTQDSIMCLKAVFNNVFTIDTIFNPLVQNYRKTHHLIPHNPNRKGLREK